MVTFDRIIALMGSERKDLRMKSYLVFTGRGSVGLIAVFTMDRWFVFFFKHYSGSLVLFVCIEKAVSITDQCLHGRIIILNEQKRDLMPRPEDDLWYACWSAQEYGEKGQDYVTTGCSLIASNLGPSKASTPVSFQTSRTQSKSDGSNYQVKPWPSLKNNAFILILNVTLVIVLLLTWRLGNVLL